MSGLADDWAPVSVAAAAGAAAVAGWAVVRAALTGRASAARVRRLLPQEELPVLGPAKDEHVSPLRAAAARGSSPVSGLVHSRLAATTAGAATALLIGGPVGVAAGVAVLLALWRWQRHSRGAPPKAPQRQVRERIREQVPTAAELLAACLAAGAGPRQSAEAVGRSLGGPLGGMLSRIAAELRLGAEPAQAWSRLKDTPDAAVLGRRMEKACRSGAPLARQVARIAAECRQAESRAAQARARRAGVLATAPLGLCFLPAFLLVGVAPMVIGLAGTVLGTV